MALPSKFPDAISIFDRPAEEIRDATGTEDANLQRRLVEQVRDALWIRADLTPGSKQQLIEAAFELLKGLKPSDLAETMLAVQMVATHSAAME